MLFHRHTKCIYRDLLRANNGEYWQLCFNLVPQTCLSDNQDKVLQSHTLSHTHSNNHMVTGSNGPQMLCPGLSEEDILMTACWSCQVFTGTQQKKEGRDNVQMRTLFTFKLVSSGTDILYITLCLEMEQCTIQREHHACRNKPKGSFRSHSLTLQRSHQPKSCLIGFYFTIPRLLVKI